MLWTLPEPMLTTAVDSPALPAGWAAEPKWDGFRAQLAVHDGGRVLLRSRQGTDMTASFPEIREAALAQLPAGTGLDGELVVWEHGRLAFERLQQRLARRGSGAVEGAGRWPTHFVVFDLVHADGADLTGWPYERRRGALETLFAERRLVAPLTLCPSTTDPAVARGWLEWTAAGLEGLCFKRLNEPYTGGARTWRKYKVRTTTEAIIGAVTGPLQAPRTVLLGRYDTAGRLQYAGRSTTLSARFGRALGDVLARPTGTHPWQGWAFSADWGTPRTLDVVLVEPAVVLEVAVDVARDAAGRFRHPARPHRVRTDVDVTQVPLFG
ncbi:ATP-dependent DNA ligase [Streptomyces lasalocidi]|uniref:ATP-dependent DNA ligase n=1 Tax=Streptomyces lasalocidi TaxID=324833 RepID=A0A4U5W4G6_STRLS|nr:ATP-dependent DNA ligase [Streptomyces lasalocidi]TKS96326.1 ATP-dependent DNA ligase [Streptomyces lasalocidi]